MHKYLHYVLYGINYVIKTKVFRKRLPFIAGLVVGESCNLSCKHCTVSSISCQNDLSYDDIKKGLSQLYGMGIRLLAITGGEPLVWRSNGKNIEDVISLAREMGFLIISVYTNGTLSLETQADDVFVSIDGLKETSNKLRGNVFDRVIKNIQRSKHPNIIVNCTINSKNKAEIEEFCGYISTIENVKGMFFYFHTPYYGKDDLFIPLEERKKIILRILSLKDKYNILNSTETLWDVYHDRWERPSDICMVYAHNKMYTCCRSVHNKEACKDCGYLGYAEVISIANLRPSALLSALQYIPKRAHTFF